MEVEGAVAAMGTVEVTAVVVGSAAAAVGSGVAAAVERAVGDSGVAGLVPHKVHLAVSAGSVVSVAGWAAAGLEGGVTGSADASVLVAEASAAADSVAAGEAAAGLAVGSAAEEEAVAGLAEEEVAEEEAVGSADLAAVTEVEVGCKAASAGSEAVQEAGSAAWYTYPPPPTEYRWMRSSGTRWVEVRDGRGAHFAAHPCS